MIEVLKRPIDKIIYNTDREPHSFCDGKFHLTNEERNFYRIMRILAPEKPEKKKSKIPTSQEPQSSQ